MSSLGSVFALVVSGRLAALLQFFVAARSNMGHGGAVTAVVVLINTLLVL